MQASPKHLFIPICSLMLMLCMGCSNSKEIIDDYPYFEKNLDSLTQMVTQLKEPIIQKNDQLNIQVSSATTNQDQTYIFNLNNQSIGGGSASGGYLVDFDGTISMPILGKIQAQGKTKNQLAADLQTLLAPHVKLPIVNIKFLNFRVLILGEISSQGYQNFPNERATIVEAIGQAGGLTDLGKRADILLIREDSDGKKEVARLNMNDAKIYQSPYFQLQQNDLIYVSPNKIKLKNINTDPTLYRDIPFFLSLFTTALAFVLLFTK